MHSLHVLVLYIGKEICLNASFLRLKCLSRSDFLDLDANDEALFVFDRKSNMKRYQSESDSPSCLKPQSKQS